MMMVKTPRNRDNICKSEHLKHKPFNLNPDTWLKSGLCSAGVPKNACTSSVILQNRSVYVGSLIHSQTLHVPEKGLQSINNGFSLVQSLSLEADSWTFTKSRPAPEASDQTLHILISKKI